MHRAFAIAAAAFVVAVSALASGVSDASASHFLKVGIFDDAQVLYGTPGADIPASRVDGLEARTREPLVVGAGHHRSEAPPGQPEKPRRSSIRLVDYDRTVTFAYNNGMQVVFSILGTPRWANGGQGWNTPPKNSADMKSFAIAASTRYSGKFVGPDGKTLPRVSSWLAWNEPNNPVFLIPQYVRSGSAWVLQSAKSYARLCNAVVEGVHSVKGGKVACGVTGPRGNNNPSTNRVSSSPIAFLRAMKRYGARGFDAYAHHPYYGSPMETPTTKPPPGKRGQDPTAVTLANLDVLTKTLTELYGNMRIWITEYGYQTNPPDASSASATRSRPPTSARRSRSPARTRASTCSSGSCSRTNRGRRDGSRGS